MPYLVCNNCDLFYEVNSKDEFNDIDSCECGNKLLYYDSLEEYLHTKGKIKKRPNEELYHKIINSYESSIARIILFCIEESPFPLDTKNTLKVLQGSKSEFLNKNRLNKMYSHSILPNISQKGFEHVKDKLIEKSLLNIDKNSSNNNLFLTKDGTIFLHDNNNINLGFIDIFEKINNEKYSTDSDPINLPRVLLNDPRGANRAHVAYLLGETKDPKYVDVLCEATQDKSANVRRLAASALGKIGDIRAENTLIKLLKDSKPQVRQFTVRALGRIKSEEALVHLETMKNDDSPYVAREVELVLINAISNSNKSKLSLENDLESSELISILLNDTDNRKRARAAYILGETNSDQYVEVLCKGTVDKNANVRRLSAIALGKIGDEKGKNSLIKLLKDPKPQVRQYAVKALGKIGSKDELNISKPSNKVIEKNGPIPRNNIKEPSSTNDNNQSLNLSQILLNDPKENERAQAAYSLGNKKDPKYVDVLCKATLDKSANVRRLAVVALGKIGDKRAEDVFIKLLKDPEPYTRQYALIGLGKTGSKKALPNINKLTRDPVLYVRKTAFETISKLKRT